MANSPVYLDRVWVKLLAGYVAPIKYANKWEELSDAYQSHVLGKPLEQSVPQMLVKLVFVLLLPLLVFIHPPLYVNIIEYTRLLPLLLCSDCGHC